MKTRKLGAAGPRIPVVGLACVGMSEFYGPAEDQKSIEVIHRALELGMTFLDAGDFYGSGLNEALVGRALRGRREHAILAAKMVVRGADGTPEHVRRACDATLERLGVDAIDLFYLHRIDPTVPVEDTMGAMADLVDAGKVRMLGVTHTSPATLRRAHAVYPIAALKTEFSLWSREPERDIVATCAELGVTFVAYSPLGRGFLSGAIQSLDDLTPADFRATTARFQEDNLAHNLEIIRRLEELARRRAVTAAQLALAWVLARGEHIVTIPGTRSLERLEENAAAPDIVLGADEIRELDDSFPLDLAAGTRNPALLTVNG